MRTALMHCLSWCSWPLSHPPFLPAALVLADDDVAGRVSDQEQQFATSVFTAAGTHFKAAALDAMPTNYQSMVGAALVVAAGQPGGACWFCGCLALAACRCHVVL
jgi:hypothetical protein